MNQPQHDRPAFGRRRHHGLTRRLIAIAAALSLLVTVALLGQANQPAFAADYPTWADVQAAQNSITAKEAQISALNGILTDLAAAVTKSQAIADQKGAAAQAAQQKFDEASAEASQVESQAQAAQTKANESKQQAGQLAAQLSRAGGTDLSTRLFFNGSEARGLLAQLGLATMVKDQSAGIYSKAVQDQKSAQSMTNQAKRAQDALKILSTSAASALAEASVAAEKATTALNEQQANQGRLEAQREILVDNKTTTEAQYNTGLAVAAQAKRDKDAADKAAADKAAADYAAAHPPSTGGNAGSGTGSGSATGGSSTGWVRPSGGGVSSPFGYRVNPVTGRWALHGGIDLAPGCNAPILAAHSGTITFAGPYGGYGNFILMDNGDGISTGYGHIVNGGILVHDQQVVSAGQQIALVGSTGQSTGCHLHFEVRPNGTAIDPAPFMRERGVSM